MTRSASPRAIKVFHFGGHETTRTHAHTHTIDKPHGWTYRTDCFFPIHPPSTVVSLHHHRSRIYLVSALPKGADEKGVTSARLTARVRHCYVPAPARKLDRQTHRHEHCSLSPSSACARSNLSVSLMRECACMFVFCCSSRLKESSASS